MDEWPKKQLGELVTIRHGYAFKGEFFSDQETGDILVTPGNFAIGGGFQLEKLKYYRGPTPEEYLLQPGDIIVTMTDLSKQADTLGYSAVVPHSKFRFLHNQRIGRLAQKSESVFLPFIGWLLRTERYRNHVIGSATGSTVKHTSPSRILDYRFSLPSVSEQEAISGTLSALDEKIELNRQMNETLEALAQAIFKDWFVTFGPTRRKAEGATDPVAILGGLIPDPTKAAPLATFFPDSFGDDGLPEGWEKREIGQDFDVTMGQSPPGDTYNEAGNGLPFYQGRRDFGWRFPTRRVYCSAPSRVSPADWTLVSVRAPVGDINRAWEECCIGRGVGAFMHRKRLGSFTYYSALHLREELASFDKDGTVFGSINQNQFKALRICGADQPAAAAFDDFVSPIDALVRMRTEENRTLAETRDYLLPKLISGAVRVRDAAAMVEEADK
ncbi:restriction endonuclease subunit S [Zhengella sp. ZM62]|uniref:restriction endonuclease subunit S n=1 Tax=Zhengella sedimenti TaxID=3390035 RepID=UPI003974AB3F